MDIAVIGNTGHLNYLFEDLPKLPECKVIAACAAGGEQPVRTLSALQKLNLPAPELFEDYRTMFDQVKVDLAVIGGPFEERAAMCKYCLERNIAVFTEKPCAIRISCTSCLMVPVRLDVSTVPGVVVLFVLPDNHWPVGSADCGRSSVSVTNVSDPADCAVSVRS